MTLSKPWRRRPPPRRLRTTTGWRDRGREALARICRGDAPLIYEAHLANAGPPWRDIPGVTIALDVGPGGRRDRHPDTRREAAENRLAELPAEATWIWSDGSATYGVLNGVIIIIIIIIPPPRTATSGRCVSRQAPSALAPARSYSP